MSLKDEPEGIDYTTPEFDTKTDKIIKSLKSDGVKKEVKKEKKKEKVLPPVYGRDDFEKCKDALKKEQENIYEDPDNHYCEIDIPKTVKLGETLKIKLSREALNVHYLLGDDYKWNKVEKYNLKSDYGINMRPTVEEKEKNKKEITIPIGRMEKISGQEHQMWLAGQYYILVRTFGTQWHEDTVSKRIIEVTK